MSAICRATSRARRGLRILKLERPVAPRHGKAPAQPASTGSICTVQSPLTSRLADADTRAQIAGVKLNFEFIYGKAQANALPLEKRFLRDPVAKKVPACSGAGAPSIAAARRLRSKRCAMARRFDVRF